MLPGRFNFFLDKASQGPVQTTHMPYGSVWSKIIAYWSDEHNFDTAGHGRQPCYISFSRATDLCGLLQHSPPSRYHWGLSSSTPPASTLNARKGVCGRVSRLLNLLEFWANLPGHTLLAASFSLTKTVTVLSCEPSKKNWFQWSFIFTSSHASIFFRSACGFTTD